MPEEIRTEGGVLKTTGSILAGVIAGIGLTVGVETQLPADEAETVGRETVARMAVVSDLSKITPTENDKASGVVSDTIIDAARYRIACRVEMPYAAGYDIVDKTVTDTNGTETIVPDTIPHIAGTKVSQPQEAFSIRPNDKSLEFSTGDLLEIVVRKNHVDVVTTAYPVEASEGKILRVWPNAPTIFEDLPAKE